MRAKHWYLAAACAAAVCALVAQTAAASMLQTPPTVTGTPQVGETITAHAGTFDVPPPAYSFTFLRCPSASDSAYTQCVPVKTTPYSQSSTATYTLTTADLGKWIRVTEQDDIYTYISDAFGQIVPVPPVNVAAPAISGVAQVGRILVGTTGTWTPAAGLTFQEAWFRCPVDDLTFGDCSITSHWATGNLTYVPQAADVGSAIRMSVVANDGYTTVGAPAAPTGPVVAAATGGTTTDVDSLTPATFTTTLHPGESASSSQSLHLAEAPAKADIVLGFDTTASMEHALDEAKAQGQSLVTSLQSAIPGVRFAVADFQDYPQSTWQGIYGLSTDHAYKLWQPLTGDPAAVQSAIGSLQLGSGGDAPEAYDRMFYEGYADPNLGFDPQAEKFLVVLGDSYPHETNGTNVAPCPVDGLPDLGRDGRHSGDDLTSQGTLAGLTAAHETLLFVTYNNNETRMATCHQALAAATGGNDVLDSSSSSLTQEIEALVLGRAQQVGSVSLSVEPSQFASWVSFDPAGPWTDVTTPADLPFTQTVTPPAGTAPGTYSFTVNAAGDGVPRASETVTVTVPEPPAVSVGDVGVTEGDAATFDVTLSKAWDEPVTVDWATADGTATAGSDYTAASGTVTFAPGETSKQVTVQTTDDTLDEPDETFDIALSNPSNASLGAPTAVATIADNDPAPVLKVTGGSGAEGDSGTSPATFTVSLSAASGKTVTVDYATQDGTATAGSDYDATSGTLTFAPGEMSKTVTTTVDGDTAFEGNESFQLVLSNASNATGSPAGTWTILDDDNRPPVCTNAAVTPETLWSPNGKLVTVTIGGCTDPDHDALTYSIVKVEQDEATGGRADAQRVAGHPNQVQLRAERLGTGNGRVYVITYTVTDGHSAPVRGTVKVFVPHDQAHAAVDSGNRIDSGL